MTQCLPRIRTCLSINGSFTFSTKKFFCDVAGRRPSAIQYCMTCHFYIPVLAVFWLVLAIPLIPHKY